MFFKFTCDANYREKYIFGRGKGGKAAAEVAQRGPFGDDAGGAANGHVAKYSKQVQQEKAGGGSSSTWKFLL